MTAAAPTSRSARRPLLIVHVVASVGLLGAVSSGVLVAIAAATERVEAESAYELLSLQSAVFGIPLSFASLLSGIALGRATRWGVVRYRWTAAKLALQLLVILNGALVLGPMVSTRLDGGGSGWSLAAAESVTVAMLLVAVVLSVLKPWGRTRRTPAGGAAVPRRDGARFRPRSDDAGAVPGESGSAPQTAPGPDERTA